MNPDRAYNDPQPGQDRPGDRGATEIATGPTVGVLTIVVHGQCYAIRLEHIRGIQRDPRIVPVPLAPPAIAGVYNLHGRLIPVVDLARPLQLEPDLSRPPRYVVNVVAGEYEAGLLVQAVEDAVEVAEDLLTAPSGELAQLVEAQFELAGRRHDLLAVAHILEAVVAR